jgi:hypothetical protein
MAAALTSSSGLCSASARALQNAFDPIAAHRAGGDRVDTDVVSAQFTRERLGKPDQPHLGGAIGAPVRIAEAAADRRHHDDAARGGLLQVGNAQARDMEGADDIDGHHRLPLVRVGFFDRRRRPRDARVVYQHVETAERIDCCSNHALDVGALRHVAGERDQAGNVFRSRLKRLRVDVARAHLRAVRGEGVRDFLADTGRTRCHQNALSHDRFQSIESC